MRLNALDWNLIDGYTETVTTFTSTVIGQILSWPVAVVAIGLIFYRPVSELIGRIESGEAPGVKFKVRTAIREAEISALESTIEETESTEGAERPTPDTAVADETAAPRDPQEETPPAAGPSRPVLLDEAEAEAEYSRWIQNTWQQRMERVDESPSLRGFDERSGKSSTLDRNEALGRVVLSYSWLERSLDLLYRLVMREEPMKYSPRTKLKGLWKRGIVNESFLESFDSLRAARNDVVHGARISRTDALDFERTAKRLRSIADSKAQEYRTQNPTLIDIPGDELDLR